jgi:four helix bundle protein
MRNKNNFSFRIPHSTLRIPNWQEVEMEREQLQHRTKQFALRGIRLVESLPKGRTAEVVGRQLLRSATSVGANYRAACRAKSTADFIAKMGIVEEEADESLYWMELLIEAGIVKAELLEALMKEADELLAMTVASINTARKRRK